MSKSVNTSKQFFTFAGVGAVGTAVHYLTLITLVESVGLKPVLASSCGATMGAIINYFLNYKFTFKSDKPHKEAMTKFMLAASAGFIVNFIIVWLLTSVIIINYIAAQIIATGIVLISNYTVNHFWTFKEAWLAANASTV